MRDVRPHLDVWSGVVIVISFFMFVAALFLKGLGHDLLLEGGVLLVSLKLIMMADIELPAAVAVKQRAC